MSRKAFALVLTGLVAAIGVPVCFYILSDAPFRSAFKDALSLLTLVGFSLLIAQFYLTRGNAPVSQAFKPALVQKLHKYLAYTAIVVILAHPYLIVVPRYFEGGVEPWTAFVTMLTQFSNIGILSGILAWLVLVAVGITAFFRRKVMRKMRKKYRGWRGLHAVLVLGFILPALFHVIMLGRHMSLGLAIYFCAALALGLVLLARLYPDRIPFASVGKSIGAKFHKAEAHPQ
ncbi:ferric reductase-like transmembrane domain-containing protein [Celeribacter halophilus]|uniref:Ferric reductase like transmembrane component n=1 Tax=Celeribacter halophilus TaxID=576117 RepID=A0A1I3PZY0_9RHOB|nr:ferric reductase-like transmembrane domain-containing protein [Celeribacter halophilus]PZX14010.1 ferric reductase like protein [Celeribacter halophilus]SFJ27464.1 Ferric reductase like transmembrane component [Celeribacter halophilus]